jgi:hypothetical protein
MVRVVKESIERRGAVFWLLIAALAYGPMWWLP